MSAAIDAPRSGVLAAGCIVVDLNKTIDRYPEPEQLAVIDSVTVSTGGPAMNVARDLARLSPGLDVAVAGVVGDDDHGRLVLNACAEDGLDATGISIDPRRATSFSDVMVERSTGRRTFFHHPGSNDLLETDHIPIASTRAKILHLGAPGLHRHMDTSAGWIDVLRSAREHGLHTNLELVSTAAETIRRVALGCLPQVDSLVVNEVEAAALCAIDPLDLGTSGVDSAVDWVALESLALALMSRGVVKLAVVHFPSGAVAADAAGRVWRQGSVRVPPSAIVSSVGAGDAFSSGILFGVHEGWSVSAALEVASSAAAASLRGLDTYTGVTSAPEVLQWARGLGFRDTLR